MTAHDSSDPDAIAAEAQRLLDAATPGPWDAGALNVYATAGCPRHAPGGDPHDPWPCVCRVVVADASDADRPLIAAAPTLARHVIALAARVTATEASVAQLRADLERADFDRQRVEGERDAIAEAAGGFLTALDAHEAEATRWQREYIPNHTAHAVVIVAAREVAIAKRTALDAALAAAGST